MTIAATDEPEPRVIPAGKVLTSTMPNADELARVTVLEETTEGGRRYVLARVSPGFEPAGSLARWTNGYYAVWTYDAGSSSRGGRQFTAEDDARATLALWLERRRETEAWKTAAREVTR